MKKPLATILCISCAFAATSAFTQETEPLPPETIGVRETIDPGPNLFIMNGGWDGLSTLQVYGALDLAYKGGMPAGLTGQSVISADGETAYIVSTYLSRIIYGDTLMVLHVFDVATLTVTAEVELPPKVAMVAAYEPMLQLSADESFIFIQNATPAASVTVVDLETLTVTTEVPTPGCWGIYPATSGVKFTSLCGDGTATTFTLDETGTTVVSQGTTPIFDVDEDPLFIHSARAGEELIFVSYHGTVYTLNDSGDAPVLVESFSFTEGLGLDFAPSGYAPIAYNAANDLLFVVMYEGPYDGSHKHSGDEIWVIDMAANALFYRAQVHPLISLWVDDEAEPTLYGYDEEEGTVTIWTVDPAAPFGVMLEEITTGEVDGWPFVTVRP